MIVLSVPMVAGLSLGITVLYVLFKALARVGRPPLPPGPKGLPLVGNLNDMPPPGVFEAHHWLKHKDIYGPISSLTILGQNLVIINDAEMVNEMFDKRSAKYSDRPRQEFAGEMMGWSMAVGLSPYGKRFRAHRKNFSRVMGSNVAAAQFSRIQEEEVAHFLLHMLEDPSRLTEHTKKEAGAVILRIGYGYIAESHKPDYLIDLVGNVMDHFSRAAVPGAYLVDLFPWLRYLPDWMPGAGFKKTAREWADELNEVTERPYAFVKHQRAQGSFEPSFLSQLLDAEDGDAEQHVTNKWSAQTLYAAGADTTVYSVISFFLAMMVYPEVQQKAQAEIDRVIGKDRLPTLTDRDELPYVDAIVKETLRWHTIVPMGLPHSTTEDDVIGGYFIPKGATLLPNVWHFTHDPDAYEDPMEFKPERYLKAVPDPDPSRFVFGFGRRICPGRILAKNTIFLNIAQALAVFNISKPFKNGKVIEPTIQSEPGVISHPMPFETSVKPRSTHHEQLIRSLEKTYPWREGHSEILESIY